MRVVGNNETRIPVTQMVEGSERSLAVVQRADRIRHDDVIERSVEGIHEHGILDIAHLEMKVRVSLPCLVDHRGAEIYSDSFRGFQCLQHIAYAATELENGRPFRNQKAHIAIVFIVEIRVPLYPTVALARHPFEEPAHRNLAGRLLWPHFRRHRSIHGRQPVFKFVDSSSNR